MEYWDLYDENRTSLGRTLARGNKIAKGEYHIIVTVWTVNSRKEILTTLRDSCKEDYPNKWENTGGAVLAAESSTQGAIRELQEETGIIAKENELIFLGTCKEQSAFIDIYFLHRDVKIEHLVLQTGETVEAKWISFEKLLEMIETEAMALPTGKQFKHIADAFSANLRAV